MVDLIGFEQPFDLIGDIGWFAAAVAVAEDGVAAPAAGVGTATSGDEGGGADAVMGLPSIEVLFEVDRLAVGPGLVGEGFDLLTGGGGDEVAIGVMKEDTGDIV